MPALVIAFDEAANLYTASKLYQATKASELCESNLGRKEQRHTVIRRVLRAMRKRPVWSMFMSTNSRIDSFAPSQENDDSARIVQGKLKREHPFLSFELDIGSKEQIRQHPEKEILKGMSDFATVEHMTMFGRPLWRLYASKSYQELRAFVKMKMLGGRPKFDVYNILHAFTVLAARVSLDPCLNSDNSPPLSKATVSSHLRLLIAVDPISGMLETATPSEPVVADIAATLLARNNGKVSDMSTWETCIGAATCIDPPQWLV